MTMLGGAIKLLSIVLLFSVMMPFQVISCFFKLNTARTIPVFVHRMLIRLLGIRIKTRGMPPGNRPTLVVSNHISWLDIVVISSLQPFSFIAKAEVEKWPVFGLLAKLQRSIFIDRTRRVATAEANDSIANRLVAGDAIILFPEGTTGDGFRLQPFRSALVGAAHAAIKQDVAKTDQNKIEIKPLAISYTRRNGLPLTRRDMPKIAWYGDMDLGPHLWAFLREGTLDVTLSWGEPIPVASGVDRKAIAAETQMQIGQMLGHFDRMKEPSSSS